MQTYARCQLTQPVKRRMLPEKESVERGCQEKCPFW